MGAKKRFAELVLQALQQRGMGISLLHGGFGNVLDSSGLSCRFSGAVRKGGPVPLLIRCESVLHDHPEAARLVIQAGAMGAEEKYLCWTWAGTFGSMISPADDQSDGTDCGGRREHGRDIKLSIQACVLLKSLMRSIDRSTLPTDHPRILRAIEPRCLGTRENMCWRLLVALQNFDCPVHWRLSDELPSTSTPMRFRTTCGTDAYHKPAQSDSKVTLMPKRRVTDLRKNPEIPN